MPDENVSLEIPRSEGIKVVKSGRAFQEIYDRPITVNDILFFITSAEAPADAEIQITERRGVISISAMWQL